MANSIILESIKEFQDSPFGHPLTCRKGCATPRVELVGTELNGKVELLCPNCGNVQELPEGIFNSEDDVSMEPKD
jgi:hypothetical protein